MDVDGVTLSYLDDGDGPTVVCLPGWSQAAEQFEPMMIALRDRFRVVALDHRGHGRSSDPGRGYRVHRLAADVQGFLDAAGLDRVCLLGHSMGVAVIWAYLELFGADRVDRLVLADQRPVLLRRPEWTDAEARLAGGIQTVEQWTARCARLRSDEGWDALVEVLRTMVSADLPPDRFDALVATNRPTSNEARAALWFDQCSIDWRDLIPTIEVPTLVVHGLASRIPLESQQWIADTVVDGALATISAERGGSHFAFWEDPIGFADVVRGFLDAPR